jgi:hypothetical protein
MVAALAGALLAACDGSGPQFSRVYMGPFGSEKAVAEAAVFQGAIPVHVDNPPFGLAADEVSARVAVLVAQSTQRPDWRFTAAGAPDDTDKTRIIFSFAPAEGVSGISLCQGKAIGKPDLGNGAATLHFRAVVCDKNRRTAEVLASLPYPVSMEDEALRTLIRGVAGALISAGKEQQR